MIESSLTVREAAEDPLIWSVLLWEVPEIGHSSKVEKYPSLSRPGQRDKVRKKGGHHLRPIGQRSEPLLKDRRMFDSKSFPSNSLLYLNAESLPVAGEILVDSAASSDFQAFAWPQLILKQGLQKESWPFPSQNGNTLLRAREFLQSELYHR